MSAKYNVGIIGYGPSAKVFHVPYLQVNPQFAIRAIVSRSSSEKAQKDHPEATVYHSAVDLFKDKGIDVVIVATPPHTHFELATQALEAGKHVIVEKPFAPTVTECNQLIELAKEKKLILTVYQNRRWDADFITLQRILAEGSFGRVVEFESHFDRYAPIGNSTDSQPVGPGTGVIFDLGTHLIDQAIVIFGSPDRVSAFLAVQQEGNNNGPRDACTVLLHYNRGLMVTIKASAVSADSEQLRFWVRGSLGSYKKYHLDTQEAQLVSGMKPSDESFGLDPVDHAGWVTRFENGRLEKAVRPNDPPKTYSEFYRTLAKALEGKGDVPVTPESARDVIRLVELAITSSEKGVTLQVE